MPEIVPAVLLGAIPSLSNAFICAAVGYFTVVTNATSTFYKVLLCLYGMGAFANWLQHRADAFFDSNFSPRESHAFRIFIPALLMSLVLVGLGKLLALEQKADTFSVQMCIFASVALAGFCAGALSGVGVAIAGSVGDQQLGLVWIGTSSAGLICIAVVYVLGFSPDSSAAVAQTFFFVASLFIFTLTAILGLFHFQGDLDVGYEKATVEGLPILQDKAEDKSVWTPWIQGMSSFVTVFCFPLLPLLCSSELAQELVLWKLSMDFLAAILLLVAPRTCAISVLATLGVVRAGLLVVTLLLFSHFTAPCRKEEQHSKRRLLVGSWDMLMLLGAVIACLSDTCSGEGVDPVAPRRQRLQKNRFAHHAALCIGVTTSGMIMYMM